MLVISAGYVGEVVRGDTLDFVFNTINSAGTPVATFTGAGGVGNPTFRWRNITSGTTGVSFITTFLNIADGLHRVVVDTSSLDLNAEYAIEVIDGEVASTDVANSVVGTFNSGGKSAGRVYEQSVKCDAGTVIDSAGAYREFDISGDDIDGLTDNYYRAQVLKFSPGAANKNIGRTILKSVPKGSNTCTITLQDGLPNPVANGDPFVILPEERELTVYWCNLTVEFGLSTGGGDQYSAEWFANGGPMQNADTILSTMGLEIIRWSDDFRLATPSWPTEIDWAPNASLFKYTGAPGNAIVSNDGVTIKASALIDDIVYTFSRTLFNNQ